MNAEILKSIADETRLSILNTLISKAQFVQEIAKRLNLAESTISFHLKKLETAGVVSKRYEQYYALYEVNPEILKLRLIDFVENHTPDISEQEKRILKYRQKVISSFMRRGKLLKIPVQYKKRSIILEEIAKEFSHDRSYDEKEIDDILKRYNEDFVSLRRYLIDENILTRKKGIYKLSDNFTLSDINFVQSEKSVKKSGDKKMDKKKEAKKEYLMNGPEMGIYKIECKENGKIFIGSSVNVKGMINRIQFELKLGNHKVKELQNDFKKYGMEKLSFEIIDILKKKDDANIDYKKELKILEDLWKEKLSSKEFYE